MARAKAGALLAGGGLGALLLAPAPPAGANTPVAKAVADDPLAVYFRHDAVGRNMQRLATTTCGTERWPVKTMADDDRDEVHLSPTDVSIRWLRHRSRPAARPQTERAGSVERHTYRVHARLREYVREDDGDYHLVLRDSHGRSIVAEIPDPACVGHISPVKRRIRAVRDRFDTHYTATTSFKTTNRRIILKGIGFFDFFHNQTGMAPNDLELHPVTGISFP